MKIVSAPHPRETLIQAEQHKAEPIQIIIQQDTPAKHYGKPGLEAKPLPALPGKGYSDDS